MSEARFYLSDAASVDDAIARARDDDAWEREQRKSAKASAAGPPRSAPVIAVAHQVPVADACAVPGAVDAAPGAVDAEAYPLPDAEAGSDADTFDLDAEMAQMVGAMASAGLQGKGDDEEEEAPEAA